jgi:prophage antirepressor-like protein
VEVGKVETGLVKVFEFKSGGRTTPVRVDMFDGQPWWIAKDVIRSLGYSVWSEPSKMTAHVPSEWKGTKSVRTPGGVQEMVCLSREGLLFFLGRSDKPDARVFQKWIAGEVVPSIMDTGAYSLLDNKDYIEALAANALRCERIEKRLDAIDSGKAQALADLYRMESPKVGAKTATMRKKIWWMVLCYCRSQGHSLSVSWNRLYDAVLLNLNVDLRQRWRNDGSKKARNALALAEELEKTKPGLMDQIYAQAFVLFQVGKVQSFVPRQALKELQ